MRKQPRTTEPPRTRRRPAASYLSAERRAELSTTAEVEIVVAADAVRGSSVLLWGEEIPPLLRDLHAAVKPACGGRSIIEMIEDELDVVVERLMDGGEAADGRDPGRAEGLGMALAYFMNPYRPDLDSIRDAAMERYHADRNEHGE